MSEELRLFQAPPVGFFPAWALDTWDYFRPNHSLMTTAWDVRSKNNPTKPRQASEPEQLTIKRFLWFWATKFWGRSLLNMDSWSSGCRRKSGPVRGMVWAASPSSLLSFLFPTVLSMQTTPVTGTTVLPSPRLVEMVPPACWTALLSRYPTHTTKSVHHRRNSKRSPRNIYFSQSVSSSMAPPQSHSPGWSSGYFHWFFLLPKFVILHPSYILQFGFHILGLSYHHHHHVSLPSFDSSLDLSHGLDATPTWSPVSSTLYCHDSCHTEQLWSCHFLLESL